MLPTRGPGVRELGLRLPPTRMLRGGRPLKRWRYVGVYGPDVMLCIGDAQVGPIRQRWWAVAEPDGTLHEGSGGVRFDGSRVAVADRGAAIDLELAAGDVPVDVVSPSGRQWIWTRKQTVPVRGRVEAGGRAWNLDGTAFIDDSAGYHERRTSWRWSAGVGRGERGERLAWNLVTGVHDAPESSERTVWVEGAPREVGPVEFAADLSRVAGLEFSEWSTREDHTNRLIFRSDYRQPFGTFRGELPDGTRLAEGYGVMEEHDVLW